MNDAKDNGESAEEAEDLQEGSLLSHLIELRSRLLKISAAVIVVFIVLVPFAGQIFEIVSAPIVAALPGGRMIATSVTSPVFTPLKLVFYAALFIAMPIVLFQLWSFVAPGLYKKEKRFAVPLLATSILLFYSGIAFAYFVVFPLMFTFFVDFAPSDVEVMTDIAPYLDFVSTLVLAFGIAFEVPIATVLIVWAGLTTPQKLGAARPYVFLGAFVFGMLLTPPDIISQTLLAIPVYLLFEMGILMSRSITTRKERAEAASDADS